MECGVLYEGHGARVYQPCRESACRRSSRQSVRLAVMAAAPRTARGRRGRSSRPPRSRARSRRSCPSTGPARAPASAPRSCSDSVAQAAERRPRLVRVRRQPADRHQARGPRGSAAPASASSAGVEVGRREAGLGRVDVDVDLERGPGSGAPGRTSGTSRSSRSREVDRVDRLDRRRTSSSARRALFDWSGPTSCQRAPGTSGALATRLLDPVLAEERQPGRDRGAQRVGGDGLGDRDERDRRRVAPGARAGIARCARGRASRARREGARRGRPGLGHGAIAGRRRRRITSGEGSSGSPGRPRRRSWRALGRDRLADRSARPAARATSGRGLVVGARRRRLGTTPPSATSSRWRWSSSRKSRSRGGRPIAAVSMTPVASRRADVALLAAVEAGRDDRDHDLVAEPLVEARAEDDVGLRVGGLADLLGRLGHLEQATGSTSR